MDEEDLKLLSDIALIDKQLEIDSASEYSLPKAGSEHENADLTSTCENPFTPSALNESCQKILKQVEEKLLKRLEENQKEQIILGKYLDQSTGKREYGLSKAVSLKIKCAGIPYFKDLNGYPQPRNEDVKEKLANKELCCVDYLTKSFMWSKQDKDALRKAVLNESNSKDLNGTKVIDWMKISVNDMNGKYSSEECESNWKLHLSDSVNKSKWTDKEVRTLEIIAAKHNFQNWDKIAEELQTKRTGFQCCIQYQSKNSLNEGKWSKEEDSYLKALVKKFTVNENNTPWTKVAWFFQTRSRKQCQDRYLEHLSTDLKKGRFSVAEDKIIIYGAKIFNDFGKLARFLPGRVPTQIRSRYYHLIRTAMPEFSKAEDELLLRLTKKHSKQWSKISENFENKSNLQCRMRFNALCKKGYARGGEFLDEPRNKRKERKKQIEQGKASLAFNEILDYFENCSENLFGPKVKVPRNDEELEEECWKVRSVMAMLSVSCDFSKKGDLIESFRDNCEFDNYDIKVLNRLREQDLSGGEHSKNDFILNGQLIPPNYFNLLGISTLMSSQHNILTKTSEAENLPRKTVITERRDDRLFYSEAVRLFKSRVNSLFYLPIALSLIPLTEEQGERFYKPKLRKPKKLSKRWLKAHAKMMSMAFQQKRKEQQSSQETPVETVPQTPPEPKGAVKRKGSERTINQPEIKRSRTRSGKV